MVTDTELKRLAKVKHSTKMLYEALGMQNQKTDLEEKLEQDISYEKARDAYMKACQNFSNAVAA